MIVAYKIIGHNTLGDINVSHRFLLGRGNVCSVSVKAEVVVCPTNFILVNFPNVINS